MDHHDHGHVPYVLLLLHHLEEWKKSHDGKVPSVYKEKNEFRDLVRAGMQTNNAEGGEENYEEAIAAVLKSLNEPTPSSAVKEVFNAEEAKNLTKDVCFPSSLFL
jgi:amyloid beta precursor protein binding protein 1